MLTLLVLIGSFFAHSNEMRNLAEKTYTRDNTFCQIGTQRIQIQIRSLNTKTELDEKKYGEYAFYYPSGIAELLPINEDHLSNFQLFQGQSTLCSKSLGYKISPDSVAILFLKENGIDPDKLTIQLFNLKNSKPTQMIETDYVTSEAQETAGGFIFKTHNPRHHLQMGETKIGDLKYTYQDRNFYYWVSYTKKGFEIDINKTFQESEMNDFFKTLKDFEKVIGWVENKKIITKTILYMAVNHKEKKRCVLFTDSNKKIDGSESDWVCR